MTEDEETRAIDHVSSAMRQHRDRLERAVGVALPLGVGALLLAALAYALDKVFFSG